MWIFIKQTVLVMKLLTAYLVCLIKITQIPFNAMALKNMSFDIYAKLTFRFWNLDESRLHW